MQRQSGDDSKAVSGENTETYKVMSVGWKWKTARSGTAKNVFTKASVQRKMRALPGPRANTEGRVSEQRILFWETGSDGGVIWSSHSKQGGDARVNMITVSANMGALSRSLVHVLLLFFKLLQLVVKYSM